MEVPRKTYNELRKFKMRVGLEAYNAIQLLENLDHYEDIRHEVKIGNTEFVFYPVNRNTVDQILKRFTTTKW